MSLPIPDPIEKDFRDALAELAAAFNVTAEATAIRLAVGEACEKRGIKIPDREALIGPPPGRRRKPGKKVAKKSAKR